jgi:hypothetical protein
MNLWSSIVGTARVLFSFIVTISILECIWHLLLVMSVQTVVHLCNYDVSVAYPEFFRGGVSTNSVEDRGQRELGSGGASPLGRGSAQVANGRNPWSY